MRYGEKPGADIGACLPEVRLGDPTYERVLHEIAPARSGGAAGSPVRPGGEIRTSGDPDAVIGLGD
jgi:hypothetical protein